MRKKKKCNEIHSKLQLIHFIINSKYNTKWVNFHTPTVKKKITRFWSCGQGGRCITNLGKIWSLKIYSIKTNLWNGNTLFPSYQMDPTIKNQSEIKFYTPHFKVSKKENWDIEDILKDGLSKLSELLFLKIPWKKYCIGTRSLFTF